MGMKKNLDDIYRVFLNDEELLRLLHYKPESLRDSRPDPLSNELPSILDMDIDQLWDIRDECIMRTSKSDDLADKSICRIYLYAGRRRPQSGNFHAATQEIIVDVLCHEDYERDSRSSWISDRINDLLCLERITGMGKTDYVSGIPIGNTPSQYVGYQQVYIVGSTKK
jgi:hypothetical protein